MVYAPHARVQWGGTIYDSADVLARVPVEIWSCTLNVAALAPADVTVAGAQIATEVATYHASTINVDARCVLEFVKVNRIGADGRYTDPETISFAKNVKGNNNAAVGSIVTSMRVSLDDGSRNPRARGGFYLPCQTTTIGSDWRWPVIHQNNVADATAAFLNAVNAIPSVTPVIASSVDGSLRPITRVRVGRRPDTQRKRANALVENYVTRTI